MKKNILISLGILISLSSSAQLLWKVSGNGLKESSYVFGTHHLSSAEICEKIEGFNDAFSSCEQFYNETDMDYMYANVMSFAKHMMLPKDSLLNTLYSEQDYRLIDDCLKANLGVGVDMLKVMKPFAISAQLSLAMVTKDMKDFDAKRAVDYTLEKRARSAGKKMNSFETADFQMGILMGEPLAEQAQALLKIVKNIDRSKEVALNMAVNYNKQDIEALYQMFFDEEFGTTPKQLNVILFNRNRNWAATLKEAMKERSTFVVVGAGHLAGEQGLLELLRKDGFTVEAVK